MIENQHAIKFILAVEAIQEALVANMTVGQTKLFEALKVDASRIHKLINIARKHFDALLQSERVADSDVRAVLDEINEASRENKKYYKMIAANVTGNHQPNKNDLSKDADLQEVVRQLKDWSDQLVRMERNLKQRFNIQ